MSSRAWTWRHAITQSDLPATTRHVLLTLSCFMNEVGEGCYPTQDDLAKATGLTERAVRTHTEIAVEKGWLKRQEHGFRGQKWKNYEYSALWPDPQDVGKGPEPRSAPSDEAPEPHSKAPEPRSAKDRKDVPPTSPDYSNTTPPERASAPWEGDFNLFWEEWPVLLRPDNRHHCAGIFRNLSEEARAAAIAQAANYRKLMACRKKPPRMVTYLRERLFAELDGSPAFDDEGRFIITPDRPEWSAWLGNIRSRFGERGVQSIVKGGRYLAPSRWPDAKAQAAA
ncbi:helix-turn-helix domain-containing protein [Mesorhizobium onobrychidis]|uniref:Helix-turn-helix domain-containing protein n=1 Tax=Mesorhizobium onobrychidis TaxID=2775404 RepID=A0ABY5QU63_9HYPH|nr:helix-turn-helix domain-containing protein [Mesorhizobium onobrychidis]UVC14725.1 helix-turn-helix domain-containing protein [Mesorhizobium onobrychidis]